jgi:hypothetical protein
MSLWTTDFLAHIFKVNYAVMRLMLWVLCVKKGKGSVTVKIKKAELKRGAHVSIIKDKLMIMKWEDKKKDICLTCTTHENKMVSARVRDKDVIKPKAVAEFTCVMPVH